MKEEIFSLMADILNISLEELKEHAQTKEIWDSLTRVEILFAIEEEYDILFKEGELATLVTPELLCTAVLAKAVAE